MVVAFTGYRPEKMPFQESKKDKRYLAFRAILSRVISRLMELGGTYFISGVARGFDTWVAEEILELRKENKEIQLECAIPFPGQADSWEKADQKRRYEILTATNEAVITSEHYNRGCFFTRNRYMVDKADVVVCAFNGKSGGTAYTVDYALKQNKIVIQIDPETSEVPQFIQRTEDDRKRPAPIMRKESGNVFKEQKVRSFNAGNPSDFKEQRSSGIFKAPSLSSD